MNSPPFFLLSFQMSSPLSSLTLRLTYSHSIEADDHISNTRHVTPSYQRLLSGKWPRRLLGDTRNINSRSSPHLLLSSLLFFSPGA
ncbi:hypothetical protein GGS26DRAFT_570032 [Hypomontagnella submonticulosa]|nr:hypothetical protein GGS26DRAFT_570032 [Hypomontagnella submonticulosa]